MSANRPRRPKGISGSTMRLLERITSGNGNTRRAFRGFDRRAVRSMKIGGNHAT